MLTIMYKINLFHARHKRGLRQNPGLIAAGGGTQVGRPSGSWPVSDPTLTGKARLAKAILCGWVVGGSAG